MHNFGCVSVIEINFMPFDLHKICDLAGLLTRPYPFLATCPSHAVPCCQGLRSGQMRDSTIGGHTAAPSVRESHPVPFSPGVATPGTKSRCKDSASQEKCQIYLSISEAQPILAEGKLVQGEHNAKKKTFFLALLRRSLSSA